MNPRSNRCALAALLVLSIAFFGAAGAPAFAQDYPSKRVRVVVNFPPGGTADQLGRVLGPRLQERLGQPFVVENRGGANGNIGALEVVRAAPDGYTLLMTPGSVITANGHLYPKLAFDPMKDLQPVASVAASTVFLVVNSALPAHTMAEFLAYLRANPGKLGFGTPGSGTSPHIAAEMFLRAAKAQATHVPYKGAGPALTDLLGGHLDFIFDPGVALPHVKTGKLRLLAVGSLKRDPAFPDTPTVAEALGEDFDAGAVFGVFAPVGTSKEVIARLNAEISSLLQVPEMRERIAAFGTEPLVLTPASFGARLRAIHERIGKLVKATGMRAE